jgi:hypothetical protein
MAGVAVGIQQSPEISSLVVGGVRLVISVSANAALIHTVVGTFNRWSFIFSAIKSTLFVPCVVLIATLAELTFSRYSLLVNLSTSITNWAR